MKCSDVSSLIADFQRGTLEEDRQNAVREHLKRCESCRAELAAAKKLAAATAQLPKSLAPQQDLWPGIEARIARAVPKDKAQAPQALGAADDPRPLRSKRLFPLLLAASVVLAAALLIFWQMSPDNADAGRDGWYVQAVEGSARLSGELLVAPDAFELQEQSWLETESGARAWLQAGGVGHISLAPNSRLRLLKSGGDQQRLELQRGTLRASISAPPRIFIVETPSATAVDLGCVYDLSVDAEGSGSLAVSIGWVELINSALRVVVPGGFSCRIHNGLGPGTPYRSGSPVELTQWLDRFDRNDEDSEVLDNLLARAGELDKLTLWYMVKRSVGPARQRLIHTLDSLAPAPRELREQGLARGDSAMLNKWLNSLGYYSWP